VFTGAFLEGLAGMVNRLSARPRIDEVKEASLDMGRLLAEAATSAPTSTRFFQAVAEQMVLADNSLFGGKYAEALTTAFVRRGLIAVRSLAAPEAVAAGTPARAAVAAVRFSAAAAGRAPARGAAASNKAAQLALDGATLGLPVKTLYVEAPPVDDAGAPVMSTMAGMAARETSAMPRVADVQAFVEALVVSGRISMQPTAGRRRDLVGSLAQARKHATHYLQKRTDDAVELRRIAFECC
jgi:hypothetical protein